MITHMLKYLFYEGTTGIFVTPGF